MAGQSRSFRKLRSPERKQLVLLVQAVNHWHEPSAALMHPFRALPDWRIDDLMISFSVPGGGVGPHLDRMMCLSFRAPAVGAGALGKGADETALPASGPAAG